jgi:hypothetical protein
MLWKRTQADAGLTPSAVRRSDLEAGFESFETDGDAFGLGVFMDGFRAVLATDSAHLVAAERNLGLIAIRVMKTLPDSKALAIFVLFRISFDQT